MSRRTNSANARLRQDYLRLQRDPVPYIVAEPLPSNILEWHYVVTGPESSPYHGGLYHGKLVFPSQFPFKPPSIYMHTPNGRFKTDTRLCLSISDYHPDTWNPAWSVSTILTGLLSFMLEKTPTLGSVETSEYEKRCFATRSHEFNLKSKVYVELFPSLVAKSKDILEKRRAAQENSASALAPDDPLARQRRRLVENAGGGFGLQSAVTNFLVLGGFAAFAFVVQYVVNTIAASDI